MRRRMFFLTTILVFMIALLTACNDDVDTSSQAQQDTEKIAAERAKAIKEQIAADNAAQEAANKKAAAEEAAAIKAANEKRQAEYKAKQAAKDAERIAKAEKAAAERAAAEQALIDSRNIYADKDKRIEIIVKDVVSGEKALKQGLIDKDIYDGARSDNKEIIHAVISFENKGFDELIVDSSKFRLDSSYATCTEFICKKSVKMGDKELFKVLFLLDGSILPEDMGFSFNQKIENTDEYLYTERKKYNIDLTHILDEHLEPTSKNENYAYENAFMDEKGLVGLELKEVLSGEEAAKRGKLAQDMRDLEKIAYFVFSIDNVGYYRDLYSKNLYFLLQCKNSSLKIEEVSNRKSVVANGDSVLFEFYTKIDTGPKGFERTDELECIKNSKIKFTLDRAVNYTASYNLYDFELFKDYIDNRIDSFNNMIAERNKIDQNPDNYILSWSNESIPSHMHGILLGQSKDIPCNPEVYKYGRKPNSLGYYNWHSESGSPYELTTAGKHFSCSIKTHTKELRFYFSADGKEVVAVDIEEGFINSGSPRIAMKKLVGFYGEPDFYYEEDDIIKALYGDGFTSELYGDSYNFFPKTTGKALIISTSCSQDIDRCSPYRTKISIIDLEKYYKANEASLLRHKKEVEASYN